MNPLNKVCHDLSMLLLILHWGPAPLHREQSSVFTYVHSHTTHTWPAVPLGLVLVVGTTCLQDGLVNTTTSSNDTFNTKTGQCWSENARGSYCADGSLYTESRKHQIQKTHWASLPTTARLAEAMTFLEPEGSFTLDFLVSGLWEMTVA